MEFPLVHLFQQNVYYHDWNNKYHQCKYQTIMHEYEVHDVLIVFLKNHMMQRFVIAEVYLSVKQKIRFIIIKNDNRFLIIQILPAKVYLQLQIYFLDQYMQQIFALVFQLEILLAHENH